jgi:serine/threonine protein kinase
MDLTVENVSGLLMRSKLMPPDQVKSLYDRWLVQGGDKVTSAPHFLRWLVAGQHLTEYQAGLVSKGLVDDYFLNQYKILDRLGRGRMAGVYKAIHQLGQVVAVKVLPPSKAKDPSILARFQREARLAQKLKHPNVVRAFQVGEARNLHYLVMEYLDGETLEEVLQRRKRLPPAEAVRLVHQALTGLQHIHEQGLVHRDLKPGNLMLVPGHQPGEPDSTLQATVKVLDIGLGRQLFDEGSSEAAAAVQLTREGTLLGTPEYMAPEQARNASGTDIRADIYSLGCTLYHCLTGQPPFRGSNLIDQLVQHATKPPPPLKELDSALPDGLQPIVNQMLAKDPAQRYPTPERAAQALQAFLTAGSAPVRRIEDAPQMRRYLTFLETGKDIDAGPATAAPPMATPLGPPVAVQAVPLLPNTNAASREELNRHKRHKHRADRAARKANGPPQIDVELVAVPAPVLPSARPKSSLSRRDWMLLGLGAGGVVLAVLVGMILAFVLQ